MIKKMRVEPYAVDSFLHVVKRGARGMPVVRDEADKWRFARLLYHMNDEFKDDFWERETSDAGPFERPEHWPERIPIVKILAWTLMPNHFHLLVKEIQEGGVSRFMHKVCASMSVQFNTKYEEKGSIFQGPFRSRTITEDTHFRYLATYIQVKNVFELYPGGLKHAASQFDTAWEWATNSYRFSSLPDFVGRCQSFITDSDLLGELFENESDFKDYSRDVILGRIEAELDDLE